VLALGGISVVSPVGAVVGGQSWPRGEPTVLMTFPELLMMVMISVVGIFAWFCCDGDQGIRRVDGRRLSAA